MTCQISVTCLLTHFRVWPAGHPVPLIPARAPHAATTTPGAAAAAAATTPASAPVSPTRASPPRSPALRAGLTAGPSAAELDAVARQARDALARFGDDDGIPSGT